MILKHYKALLVITKNHRQYYEKQKYEIVKSKW